MITDFFQDIPKALTAASLILIIGFIGFTFSGLSGSEKIPMDRCENLEITSDNNFEFWCNDISSSSVGSTPVFYTHTTQSGLETFDTGNPDPYVEAARYLVLDETNLSSSEVGGGNECKRDASDPVICATSSSSSQVEEVLNRYGGYDYVYDGGLDELYEGEWSGAYRLDSPESIINAYSDYSSCTADVVWDNWDADQGQRNEEITVEGDVVYVDSTSDGIGCQVSNPDPDKFGHVEDVNRVSFSIDLDRTEIVSGYEVSGDSCVEAEYEEEMVPEDFYSSESTCVESLSTEDSGDGQDDSSEEEETQNPDDQESVSILQALIDFLVFWK